MSYNNFQYELVQDPANNINRTKGLQQKNHLKNQVIEKLQNAFWQSERQFGPLTDQLPDIIYSLDHNGIILSVNKAVCRYGFKPQELIGRAFTELIHPSDRQPTLESFINMLDRKNDQVVVQQFRIITKSVKVRWLEVNASLTADDRHGPAQVGVCRDVTESMRYQHGLIKIQSNLEQQVKIRTCELLRANSRLQKEVVERSCTERALRERETELEREKTNLEKTNTALRVLLKHREVDKRELEDRVLYNIKKLVLPYLEKLKKSVTTERQKSNIHILESNINDVINSFLPRLSLRNSNLTGSELKMANFIRQGKRTREIAESTGLSTRTIETYRLSIRRKFNLTRKKVNLRTFLLSIDNQIKKQDETFTPG